MPLKHDRRFMTALIAAAALLLGGAVAFATSWLPSAGGSKPTLPMVVTSRPVESPLTSVFASPTPAAEATPSAAATPAPSPVTPRVNPVKPAPAPRPNEGVKTPPKPKREVVTPPVREKDEHDGDREQSARRAAVRPLGVAGDGGYKRDDDGDDGEHESRRAREVRAPRRESSERRGDGKPEKRAGRGGDERRKGRGGE